MHLSSYNQLTTIMFGMPFLFNFSTIVSYILPLSVNGYALPVQPKLKKKTVDVFSEDCPCCCFTLFVLHNNIIALSNSIFLLLAWLSLVLMSATLTESYLLSVFPLIVSESFNYFEC